MRWLLAAVIGMGVLILCGTVFMVGVIISRVSTPQALRAAAALDEPPGSVVTGTSFGGDRLAIALHGGGADRVVVVDLRSGRVLERVRIEK